LRQIKGYNLVKSLEIQILTKVKKAGRGSLFFADNFTTRGSKKNIAKTLERLVKSGKIHRVAPGIYVRPIEDKVLGPVFPDIEEIAKAVAKRDKARIVPTGIYALYKLGLTTQVPLNAVYYTNASARKIQIGKQTITFKRASAKNLSAIGDISKLAIQALRSIGKNKVTADEVNKITMLLKKEKPFHLHHDIKIAPEWIRKLLHPLLNDAANG